MKHKKTCLYVVIVIFSLLFCQPLDILLIIFNSCHNIIKNIKRKIISSSSIKNSIKICIISITNISSSSSSRSSSSSSRSICINKSIIIISSSSKIFTVSVACVEDRMGYVVVVVKVVTDVCRLYGLFIRSAT